MLKISGAQFLRLPWSLGLLIALALGEFGYSEERDPICMENAASPSLESQFHHLSIEPAELLARLVWAEMESLISGPNAKPNKCAAKFETYAKAIAWTVRARVELSKRYPHLRKQFGADWYGVVFKKDQFNPAISKKSEYRKFFICPQKSPRFLKHWKGTHELADKVTDKHTLSPLVTTPLELSEGYSLIAHLYYPLSQQTTKIPPEWVTALERTKQNVRELKFDGITLGDECLWLFREKVRK